MPEEKHHFIEYRLPEEWIVLVGRTESDNDYLSTTLAAPTDWWFHADAVPGAHVILRAKPGSEPGIVIQKRAAAIAGYHSKARKLGTAAIYCTQASNVRKPRGAEVGSVEVVNGKILRVQPDISFVIGTRKVSE